MAIVWLLLVAGIAPTAWGWTTPASVVTWSATTLDGVPGASQALDTVTDAAGVQHWAYVRVSQQQAGATITTVSEVHCGNSQGQDFIVQSAVQTIVMGQTTTYSGAVLGKPSVTVDANNVYVGYMESLPDITGDPFTTSVKLEMKEIGASSFSPLPATSSVWVASNIYDHSATDAQSLDIAVDGDGVLHWTYMRTAESFLPTQSIKTTTIRYGNNAGAGEDSEVLTATYTSTGKSQAIGTSVSGAVLGQPTLALADGTLYLGFWRSVPDITGATFTNGVLLTTRAGGSFATPVSVGQTWMSIVRDSATGTDPLASSQTLDLAVETGGVVHWVFRRTEGTQTPTTFSVTTKIEYANSLGEAEMIRQEVFSGPLPPGPPFTGNLIGKPSISLAPDSALRVAYLRTSASSAVNTDIMLTSKASTAPRYTLTLQRNPAIGGSINASPLPDVDGKYASGQVVTLTAVANSGYQFDSWSGVDSQNGNSATVVMNNDKTVTAAFSLLQSPRYALTLTALPTAGGSITPTPAPGQDGRYDEGQTVNLHAVPSVGYRFVSWTGADSSNDADATVVMTGDRAVTATFALIEPPRFTLTLTTIPLAGGSITPTPGPGQDGKYPQGETVALQAVPNAGYQFVSWTDVDSSNGPNAAVAMTGARTVTATFALIQDPRVTLTLTASPTAGGVINPAPSPGLDGKYDRGQSVNLQAVPNTGYQFVSWSGVDISSGANATVIMNGDRTVSAIFTPIQQGRYMLTLQTYPPSAGVITPSQPTGQDGLYPSGATLSLTATAAPLYKFVSWQGVDAASGKVATVVMNGDRVVTALFVGYRDAADVNGDLSWDAVDVQLVINAALNLPVGLDCDIDGNGGVDAVDVQLAINAALRVL
ncbi:MAG TPA: hypothetical protein PLO62_02585 [Candidatus Hydrogenedentes bacterium]|mgnify:CR=1 FL=1|nr:hypothetical protein [Candidatus Hydrogenedentota bacterium]